MDLETRLVECARQGKFIGSSEVSDLHVLFIRALRRHGPAEVRRGALIALVHLLGEAGLHEVDLAVLRRLIRIKRATDAPYGFDACFNNWLTVRGGDQPGIMRVLGLTDAMPATYGLGETLVSHLAHGGPTRDETYDHVFISPEINGWTVVRGQSCNPNRSPRVQRWLEDLSHEYGQAQAYYYGSQGDGTAWLVAEAGHLVRRYSSEHPERSFGAPLQIEREWLDRLGFSGAPEDLVDDEAFQDSFFDLKCSATEVARHMSVDPLGDPPTPLEVRGGALIARTDEGRRQSVLRDCYWMRI